MSLSTIIGGTLIFLVVYFLCRNQWVYKLYAEASRRHVYLNPYIYDRIVFKHFWRWNREYYLKEKGRG